MSACQTHPKRPVPPALLDPEESTVWCPTCFSSAHKPTAHLPPELRYPRCPPSPQFAFRHSGWQKTRYRVWLAMNDADVHERRVTAFRDCGKYAFLLESTVDPGTYKFVAVACHDRLCQPCGQLRAATIRENLTRHLPDEPHRLITLTLRSSPQPLVEQLARLTRCFRRLRARSLWKERVYGGAVFVELTLNADTHLWHPHLHAIVAGTYIPQPALSQDWLDVTGDSIVVDVRLIRNREQLLHYITKYVAKPLHHSVTHSHPHLIEALRDLANRKLVWCFGNWSHFRLLESRSDNAWTLIGLADEVLHNNTLSPETTEVLLTAYAAYQNNDSSTEIYIPTERSPPCTAKVPTSTT